MVPKLLQGPLTSSSVYLENGAGFLLVAAGRPPSPGDKVNKQTTSHPNEAVPKSSLAATLLQPLQNASFRSSDGRWQGGWGGKQRENRWRAETVASVEKK